MAPPCLVGVRKTGVSFYWHLHSVAGVLHQISKYFHLNRHMTWAASEIAYFPLVEENQYVTK